MIFLFCFVCFEVFLGKFPGELPSLCAAGGAGGASGAAGPGAPPSAGGAGSGTGNGAGIGAMAGPEAASAAAAAEGNGAGNGGRDGYDGKCVFCRIARREEPGTALLPCEVREAPPSRLLPRSLTGCPGVAAALRPSAPAWTQRGTSLPRRAPCRP